MKHLATISTFLFLAFAAAAAPADSSLLARLATRILGRPVVDATPPAFADMRLFHGADGRGFVLLSADDCVAPLLAYSPDGAFPTNPDAMPLHVAAWLDGYRTHLALARERRQDASAAWRALLAGTAPKNADTVAPLLTTRWNQLPPYNALCPRHPDDTLHALTGCVPTAVAQVMKYWNHPATGWGSYSYTNTGRGTDYGPLSVAFDTANYAWHLMPDTLTPASDSASIRAVAQLMFHIGVAIGTHFGTNASGAQLSDRDPSAETALKNHFRYSPLLHSVDRRNYTASQWDSLLRFELARRRPVLYSAYSPTMSGHCIVLDGVDSRGLYHVNWGWGGVYNGFFSISDLSVANRSYPNNHTALIGVEPIVPSSTSQATVTLRPADAAHGSVEGSGTYALSADTVTLLAHAAPGYRFLRWASGSHANPATFLLHGDIADTALFVPVQSPVVSYCTDDWRSAWRSSDGETVWALRIDPLELPSQAKISAVQLCTYAGAFINIKVLSGPDPATADELAATDRYLNGDSARHWVTVPLPTPTDFDPAVPLWIVLSSTSSEYPASYSHYGGRPDGTWYRTSDGWVQYSTLDRPYSWMIRALFSQPQGITDGPEAAPDVRWSVSGRTIRLVNPQHLQVDLHDLLGRRLASSACSFTVPSPGVYILTTGGQALGRAVVLE